MIITQVEPRTIALEYRQEHGDPDYGSCLWARFVFDLDNYTLSIQSDCGSYAYGWCVTPSETFLHLCGRLEQGYLLDKLSNRAVIDEEETLVNLREYLGECGLPEADLWDSSGFWDCVKGAVYDASCAEILIRELIDIVSMYPEYDVDEYDLYYQIETDYPAGARKITEIFCKHIAPILRAMGERGA